MRRLLHTTRDRIKRAIQWMWAQEGSPGQRARGLAAGVFCGSFPFFGLQIVLSVGLATLVRGNHLLAAAGTLVSNPITYVPLYWFNYQVGCRLLGPGEGSSALEAFTHETLWAQGWEFTQRILLGSSVIGMLLAIGGGLMAYRLFQQRDAGTVISGQS